MGNTKDDLIIPGISQMASPGSNFWHIALAPADELKNIAKAGRLAGNALLATSVVTPES